MGHLLVYFWLNSGIELEEVGRQKLVDAQGIDIR
ncbi:Uncharacterised protein [Raoultella terrigena]|uniref:Uncharacterized protein n=1 Tax=Raoultella terrigena TaxID=577 RepID=A0A3P8JH74_RAOTE|nr:Uncharacterised protein [Raoultella terrigena]